MARVIEVIISPQGETTLETKGFFGSGCLEASKFLEQSLGVAATERKTPDFYRTTDTEQHARSSE